jgi:hypothetical protein
MQQGDDMDNLADNSMPSLTELGGEPLLGSGFEAEPSDPDFTTEHTQPLEERAR